MKVAVGCPVRDRAWIFNEWLEHVLVAFEVANLTPYFVFTIGTSVDDTHDLVTETFRHYGGMWCDEDEDINQHLEPGMRVWNNSRYNTMVRVRNRLLEMVRVMQPDYFLSLDSDILIHPVALMSLIETLTHGVTQRRSRERLLPDAVAGKCYLSKSSRLPNYLTKKANGGWHREDQENVFEVDVIMALKLMNTAAYNVDYRHDPYGEDIGWSLACHDRGLHLVWDGRIASKHCMVPQQLAEVDPRIGW